ncbi:hypothetical protein [Synechococcus sp. UW140]|uniref:hypothetical protein n=1 Tax=Synechococcus sp. UW140 TaxID=368503 RepID=UPI003137A8CB
MDAPPEKTEGKKSINFTKWILLIFFGSIGFLIFAIYHAPKDDNNGRGKETNGNSWYSSNDRNYDCEYELKQKLGDPNSYSRSGGFNSINDLGNEKQIVWKYRAKNAYGGYILNNGVCTIYKDGEVVRITAMDGFNFSN